MHVPKTKRGAITAPSPALGYTLALSEPKCYIAVMISRLGSTMAECIALLPHSRDVVSSTAGPRQFCVNFSPCPRGFFVFLLQSKNMHEVNWSISLNCLLTCSKCECFFVCLCPHVALINWQHVTWPSPMMWNQIF